MKPKTDEKRLELELYFDETQNRWMIHSPAGAGLTATDFEVCLWKEIIKLRRQLAYLRTRNNHMREMIAAVNSEKLNEK
jgi:hypothetical protein